VRQGTAVVPAEYAARPPRERLFYPKRWFLSTKRKRRTARNNHSASTEGQPTGAAEAVIGGISPKVVDRNVVFCELTPYSPRMRSVIALPPAAGGSKISLSPLKSCRFLMSRDAE
jgi:hypothetical protein